MPPQRLKGFKYAAAVQDPNQVFEAIRMQQELARQAQMAQQQPDQGPGGLLGFFGDVAGGISRPFVKGVNTLGQQANQIANTGKMYLADATNNDEAWRNANEQAKRDYESTKNNSGGLLNMGGYFSGEEAQRGDFATGAKRVGGNTAQQLATVAPVGRAASLVGKVAQGAGAGAVFGGGQGLANDASLEDTINQALTGGLMGGAFGGAAGVGGKVLNKLSGGKGLNTASTIGQQMESRSGGFGVGSKQSGSAPLGLKESKRITSLLSSEGIKAGNPIRRLGDVENKLAQYGQQIDDHLSQANRTLSDVERQGLADEFLGAIDKLPNANPTVRRNAAQLAENLRSQVTDLKSLVGFRRGLDQDAISYISNPDAATAANQQAAKVLRKLISKKTSDLIPEVKDINLTYSKLADARNYLIQGGKGVNNPKGGLINRVLESGPVQSVESKAGAAMSRSADALSGFGDNLPSLPGTNKLGTAANLATISALSGAGQQEPQQPQGLEDALMQMSNPMGQGGAMQPPQAPQQQSPYSREALIADIQRDPENTDSYMQLFGQLQEAYAPAAQGPELTNTAVQSISDLQTGIDNLDLLGQDIAQSGANAPVIGNLRSRNPFDTEAKSLRAEIDRVKQVVGKALEGGVLRKEDEEKYARILPTINDTDAVAAQKINAIRNDLTNKLQTFYSNSVQYGGGGGGLTDAIMAAQQPAGRY